MTRAERVRGGLYGLLVGDALGVPYEFHDPANLPPGDAIEMVPPPGFRRSHAGTPPGTWSDDGAQALCLLASLLDRGRLDPQDLGDRFVRWWSRGEMTPDGRPFDIGNQTSDALLRIEAGTPALQAGGRQESENGNGSLMRALPLALWHTGPDDALVQDAYLQSRITHGHPRSEVACALYVLWARRILADHPSPFADAEATLRGLATGAHRQELDVVLAPREARGTGYVVDTVHSARIALQEPDYASVVRRAIAFGHDTDTTACVAGGIAGLRFGEQGIPARWREALRGRDQVEALLARL